MYSPTKIARIVKSITAKELFKRKPEVKEKLWGGEFWTDGYFINSVSKHGSEGVVMKYVKNQGKQRDYVILHKDQLRLDLV
jgi:REP element-mobilizing transposase RayT